MLFFNEHYDSFLRGVTLGDETCVASKQTTQHPLLHTVLLHLLPYVIKQEFLSLCPRPATATIFLSDSSIQHGKLTGVGARTIHQDAYL